MKFSCSQMETLVSGDSCSTSAVFEASVVKQGSFIARVKRTGQRSKHVGWVDLMLLDSDRLAICYLEDDTPTDILPLVFPLLDGSEFGSVRRHGNAITLQAARVSLVLEVEAFDTVDEESSTIFAGKWARILNRLVSGETAQADGYGSYYGGLGISVQAPKAVPPPVALASPVDRPRPRTKQLVPQPAVSTFGGDRLNGVHSMYAPQFMGNMQVNAPPPPAAASIPSATSMPRITTQIPNSKTLKRISLCLMGSADLGFGDDLKNVLQTLDEPEEPEQPSQTESAPQQQSATDKNADTEALPAPQNLSRDASENGIPSALLPSKQFTAPCAPFSNTNNNGAPSASSTPSPNSLYLESSSPPIDFGIGGESPKRLDSILAKERQQYAEKYGDRAASVAAFQKPSKTASVRVPPNIPAPIRSKSAEELEEKAPAATANAASKNKKARDGKLAAESAKTNTAKTAKVSASSSSAKTGPVLSRKTVSIAPEVHVIKEQGDDEDDDETEFAAEAKVDAEADKNSDLSSSLDLPAPKFTTAETGSPKSMKGSPSLSTPVLEQKARLVKAVKRILGKKKPKKGSQFVVMGQAHDERSKSTNDLSVPRESDGPRSPESLDSPEPTKQRAASMVSPDLDAPASPESLKTAHHVYAHLIAGEPDLTPEIAPLNPETSEEPTTASKEPTEESVKANDDTLQATSKTVDGETRGVVVNSMNNGRVTAAPPRLDSRKSISALSFRSLSSRSISSRSTSAGDIASFYSAATTPEKVVVEKPSFVSNEIIKEEDDDEQPQSKQQLKQQQQQQLQEQDKQSDGEQPTESPVQLRRESRDDIDPVPISLGDGPIALTSRLYGLGNKSTSALPSESEHSHQKQASTASSYSSMGSKRSLQSYASSVSSASSFSTPNLLKNDIRSDPRLSGGAKSEVSLFSAHLWVSVWRESRWKPLSQLELQTDIIASNMDSAAVCIPSEAKTLKFNSQVEMRRVGNHDVEFKGTDDIYMFRGRDSEDAQRFFRTLWTIQANGVQPVVAAALANNGAVRGSEDESHIMVNRRRTLQPPCLSRSNQSLRYMGRSTETIVEE